MDVDRLVAAIASRHCGVFTLAQLIALGVTHAMVRVRVASGRWVRIHRGVFMLAGSPATWQQRLTAAWLAAGDGAVVSHLAAAACWGLPDIPRRLEVSVPAGRRPNPNGVVIHRVRSLAAVDVVEEAKLRLTTPTRTLIDISGHLPDDRMSVALDHCLSRRMTSVAFLGRRLDGIGPQGRAGAALLRELLAARPAGGRPPESELERRLLRLLSQLPGPRPVPQYEVRLPNGRVVRIDVAYPESLFGLEGDSYAHHSSRTDWARDHTRRNALVALGWRILPVTWDDVTQRPDEVLDLVARGRRGERCTGEAV